MPLDRKDRIQDLCAELSSSSDPGRVHDLSSELQLAIHEHIEDLRRRLLNVPAARPFQQPSIEISDRFGKLELDSSLGRSTSQKKISG